MKDFSAFLLFSGIKMGSSEKAEQTAAQLREENKWLERELIEVNRENGILKKEK